MRFFVPPSALALISLLCMPPAFAHASDEPHEDPFGPLHWVEEGVAKLGQRAELQVPKGYRFGDTKTAVAALTMMGNIPSETTLGLIGPSELEWFAVYEFEDVGYIEDDDSDLDADGLLSKLRRNSQSSNEVRKERGLATVHIDGWALPPTYNRETKVLEWATLATFSDPGGESSQTVNFRTKVLGRKGYMDVVVVCDPENLEATLPEYRAMMQSFAFSDGERYDQFKQGDAIAKYGLAALVAGGAAAVAAKTGLLAGLLLFLKKGAKLIVVGVAALAAGVAKLFGRKPKH